MFEDACLGAGSVMEKSPGRRLLTDATTLVGRGWCQGAEAVGQDGETLDPWDDQAVSWSLLGAIVAVLESEARDAGEIPFEELATALNALAAIIHVDSLAVWNDDPERTQQKVLATLAAAKGCYESPCPDGAAFTLN
jgi:hypothetical protein